MYYIRSMIPVDNITSVYMNVCTYVFMCMYICMHVGNFTSPLSCWIASRVAKYWKQQIS